MVSHASGLAARPTDAPPIGVSTADPALVTASSGGSGLTGVADWAVGVMDSLGAPGAGLLVALENLFPPLPSEVILPLAGFAASRGSMSLAGAIALTTLGSLVGAIALYYIGMALGRDRMFALAGRVPLVDVDDLLKTEAWFVRHGNAGVFFGRMVPIFRSLISIPAGLEKMPLPRFAILTTAGSLVWNSIFVVAGFYLGENWQVVERYAGVFQKIVIALLVVGLAAYIVVRIRRSRRTDPDEKKNAEVSSS